MSISLSFLNYKKPSNIFIVFFKAYLLATKNLDQVIDINFYPTDKTQKSNSLHRPVGLGVQGLADVFFMLNLPYDSKEAAEINKKIFETIYFGAIEASVEMAKEKGTYSSYEGSPLSNGKFQFDLWNVQPSDLWDWEGLKAKEVDFFFS